MTCLVKMIRDSEAAVWGTTSDDVPGLVMESGFLDALMERVRFAIPEMIRLNNIISINPIPVIFRSERTDAVAAV